MDYFEEAAIEATRYYFWLGREAAEDAFEIAFALWAYDLDGSGAERAFRRRFGV